MRLYEDCVNPTVCQLCGEVFEYDEFEHGACYECFEKMKADYGAVRAYALAYPEDFEGFKDNESLSSYQTAINGNEDDYVRFYVGREVEIYETKRLMRDLTDIAYEINQNTVIDVILEYHFVCGIVECRLYPYGFDNSEEMYYVTVNGDKPTSEKYERIKITAENLNKLIISLRKIWDVQSEKLKEY